MTVHNKNAAKTDSVSEGRLDVKVLNMDGWTLRRVETAFLADEPRLHRGTRNMRQSDYWLAHKDRGNYNLAVRYQSTRSTFLSDDLERI